MGFSTRSFSLGFYRVGMLELLRHFNILPPKLVYELDIFSAHCMFESADLELDFWKLLNRSQFHC